MKQEPTEETFVTKGSHVIDAGKRGSKENMAVILVELHPKSFSGEGIQESILLPPKEMQAQTMKESLRRARRGREETPRRSGNGSSSMLKADAKKLKFLEKKTPYQKKSSYSDLSPRGFFGDKQRTERKEKPGRRSIVRKSSESNYRRRTDLK